MTRPIPLWLWGVAGGIAGLLFFSLAVLSASHEPLRGDVAIFHWIRTWQSPVLNSAMRTVTLLGDRKVLIPLALLVALVLWRRWRQFAIAQCGLLVGVPLFEWLTKQWVARPRPEGAGVGFPSGHVLAATVIYGLIAYLLLQAVSRTWERWAVVVIFVAVVGAVGISRIYLQAHWPSDVVGGAIGGIAYLIPGLAWLDRTGPVGLRSGPERRR